MTKETGGTDRRRQERKLFRGERAGVRFSVRVGGELCEILNVHDVSISGIRLGMDRPFVVGQGIELIAEESDFSISVTGTVRWVTQVLDVFEFGVEFDSADVDNNILFFMSLRKYIDGFDDVPAKDL